MTAKEAWDKLEKNFQSTGVIQKVTLRRELLRTRFEDFKCMEDYLNRMYSLARELRTVQAPVPDEDLAIMILANLPSSYDTLIITMENSRNELNLDEVRCKLIQEEARRNLNDSESNENSALKVTSSKKRDFSTYKCYNCNEYGHIARYCRKRRRGTTARDAASASSSKGMNEVHALNCYVETMKSSEWCIDSGATRHMTSQRSILTDFQKEKCSRVKTADGKMIRSLGHGNVKLDVAVNGVDRPIMVTNVLYSPDLEMNLISVSTLTRKGFDVKFSKDKKCKVFDSNGRLSLTASLRDGLYIVDKARKTCSVNVAHESAEKKYQTRPANVGHKKRQFSNRRQRRAKRQTEFCRIVRDEDKDGVSSAEVKDVLGSATEVKNECEEKLPDVKCLMNELQSFKEESQAQINQMHQLFHAMKDAYCDTLKEIQQSCEQRMQSISGRLTTMMEENTLLKSLVKWSRSTKDGRVFLMMKKMIN